MRPYRSSVRAAVRGLLPTLILAAASSSARAQSTLTFEDLCYHSDPSCAFVAPTVLFDGGPIMSSYAAFSWTNFRGLDLVNYSLHRPDPDPTIAGTSGYPFAGGPYSDVVGLGFGEVVVRRPVGSTFGQFQFSDFAIGSGWTEGMTLTITGSLAGNTVFTAPTQTLHATSTSQLLLPNVWVDQLTLTPTFTPPGYTDPYQSAAQNGGTPYMSFWFDNVDYLVRDPSVVTTPEPGTLALLAGGLAVVGAFGARRRRD